MYNIHLSLLASIPGIQQDFITLQSMTPNCHTIFRKNFKKCDNLGTLSPRSVWTIIKQNKNEKSVTIWDYGLYLTKAISRPRFG